MQDSQANCGPVALSNALKALGITRSLEELEALCKTDATTGTPIKRLVAGIDKLENVQAVVLHEAREDVAMLRLRFAVRAGTPAIAVVDEGEHYVAVIGFIGENILVCDSADNELVLSYPPRDWAKRWRDSGKKPFWAVTLAVSNG